jgi:hypothetical protein
MLTKIVSGGQTGVDRAALDVAMELGIPCGGWVPLGRLAEDGPLHPCYPLQETPTAVYAERTEWNVRDSDGTLVLAQGPVAGGTKLTVELAAGHHKPCLVLDPSGATVAVTIREWLDRHGVKILNIAGPRESESPGLYSAARTILLQFLCEPGIMEAGPASFAD